MTKPLPLLHSERLILRIPEPSEAGELVRHFQANKEHLAQSGLTPPSNFYTEAFWTDQLAQYSEEFQADSSLRLFAFEHTTPYRVVASISFMHFLRKGAQFCHLGYGIDREKQGQGFMKEGITAAIKYVFEEMNLHRIMANYMPTNERSGKLLKSLGFTIEGYARDYLLVNGIWQDHIMTSLTNPNWHPDASLGTDEDSERHSK